MNLTNPQKLIYDMEKFAGGSISIVCGSMLIDTDKSIDEIKKAVNKLYHFNDALRMRVSEKDGQPYQYVTECHEQDIDVLNFKSKEELDNYASEYAKEPLDFYGSLCDIKIVVLPDKKGLLAKLHHFISDAWTLSLLGTQFNALLKGEEIETYSYADYVNAEELYVEGKRYAKDKNYFISQFKKCDEVTYLSDKPSHSYDANRETFIIEHDKAKMINKFATEHGTSVFNLFMAILATYVNRVKMNAEKFYIGTAVLNRNGIKEQNTMGMFINSAPVLIELSNDESFAYNLESVQDSLFSVLRHQKYNYGTLLEELRKNHSFSEKLYDVIFSYQNAKILGGEIETTWYHSGMQTESLQIHIDDRDSEGIFKIHYDYLIEKFSKYDINMLHKHICNLLYDVLENSNKKLYELNILTDDEKQKLFFDFNDTAVDYPKDKCIHELFEEQAKKYPDKIAIIACDKSLTYKELNEEANKIACSLVEKGVSSGDVVAFMLPRKSYLISTMLGILKSGAAYMPIDIHSPQDRIDFVLSDSNSSFLITEENIHNLLDNKTLNSTVEITSDNSCYCIYTSGSTGQPKGVIINHNNLTNFCFDTDKNITQHYISNNCNVVLSCGSITFDISVFEIFVTFLNGLTLVLANEEAINSPQSLAHLIEKYNVDAILATPSKISLYFDNYDFQNAAFRLKSLMIGAEVFTQELLNKISRYTSAIIFNGYGPTECTIGASFSFVNESNCVQMLLEKQVNKTPDRTALIACDNSLSYKELNELANKIAHSLINQGIKKNDIIAFQLSRNSLLVACMLGILKTGSSYMPIDPTYPQDRVNYMVEDIGAKLCITDDTVKALIDNSNTENPRIYNSSEERFCVLHTSGSTGMPKGAAIKHINMVNFVNSNQFLLKGIDNVIAINTVTFDVFEMDTIFALVSGTVCVLASEEQQFNQDSFERLMSSYKNSLFFSTPTKITNYINNSATGEFFKNINCYIVGGEILKPELLDTIRTLNPNVDIYTVYGPTETLIYSTLVDVSKTNDISIGHPIANTQIYIVDKFMKPTPVGVTGELCICGDGVGAGYLNRPELTAEKFIDNPFGKGKMYKTGDLAYWREDGNIAYVGRNDFQVKIRGLRIELGEIETCISTVDGINMSVVIVRKNSEGRQFICAFYTGEEKSAQEIKAVIGEKLPKYMLPHIFTHIDEMPLTSSGKINRKALPEIDFENISNNTEYVAPTTDTEKLLCSLVSKTLNIEKIGVEDDFFELGGDSLKAIEFVSKAHVQGVYFALQDVFDNPTVKFLCEFMRTKDKQHNSYNKDDFIEIHKMLENNLDDGFVPQKSDIGDVLVTGATGFLGIHVVSEFLESESGKVYCLVRGKDDSDATARFGKLLNYYFDGKYVDLIGNRIIVLCGDAEKQNLGLEALPNVSMVINTAASVKHYGSYKYFHDINVCGAINAMNVAKSVGARFVQVSTLSVSGNSMADIFDAIRSDEYKTFSENDLYIDQQLDNVYIRSKFEAEYAILKEMLNGMQANIIRVGNLTNRASDFKFQPNYQSNAFLSRVKAVLEMGVFPDYLLDLYAEFSPIDDTAKAIIKIAQHFNDHKTVFHVNSQKVVYFDKFIEYMGKLGINLDVLKGKDFAERLAELEHNDATRYIYEALINDMDENGNLVYDSNIHIENEHTLKYLDKIGFDWSEINLEYLKGYFDYFRNIGYLEV